MSGGSKGRDMTQLSAVRGLAAWLGKGSGAIVVMVLRGEDHAFYVDPLCTPSDAADAVELVLPEMIAELHIERRMAKEKQQEALLKSNR